MNKLPETSLSAYKQANIELAARHKEKILEALSRSIAPMSMEQIAKEAGMDYHQVGRRISELLKDDKIFICQIKSKTSTGRACQTYKLSYPQKELQKYFDDLQAGKFEEQQPPMIGPVQQQLF